MPGIADTLQGLKRLRGQRDSMLANLSDPMRLTLVAPAGPNPGELRMMCFVPPGLPEGAPLVVVLHGCTQNAAAYDAGSGWSVLAERHGFALLFPEQQRGNNANLCFNWFNPGDTARGQGEVESIRQMVLQTIRTHRLDGRRVFVTGLSAGGAMTAAMLATAPELFAGGAIVAGLPYGSASGMGEAFSAMGHPQHRTPAAWGDLVRRATPHRGPWPAVQVWQGTADSTVAPANAEELVRQWGNVLGLPDAPGITETVDGATHEYWPGTDGRPALERWTVPGLGHGTPVRVGGGDADQLAGVPGPHMLASTISATWHMAQAWGLLTQAARPAPAKTLRRGPAPDSPSSIIERTLRAAGVLK